MSPHRHSTAGIAAPEPSDHLVPLFASTIHGLETIAAAELAARGHQVLSIRRRQILLASPTRLATDQPRTVDDLLLQIAQAPDPGPTKAGLALLQRQLHSADLAHVPEAFHGPGRVFAVSASIMGQRTFNRYDLEEAIGTALADRLSARFACGAATLGHPRVWSNGASRSPPKGSCWGFGATAPRCTGGRGRPPRSPAPFTLRSQRPWPASPGSDRT